MSRIAPLLCPLLVGRDDLLDLADRRIADAAAGRGQFLLLAGEAGIGKTRLLGALWRKADLIRKRWRTLSLSDLDCSLQITRTAMKRAPVTAVLTDRPSMLRPEMKSPTAVPAALIKRPANKTAAKEAAHRALPGTTPP